MILKVIASGSRGNSYALIGKDEILLIEAGVSLLEIKKNIDFMISKVAGCIVSHEHLDHARYIDEYRKAGIKVYAPESMSSCVIKPMETRQIGGFKVTPFDCVHDVDCLGYLIKHDTIGRLLFATDTEFIRYRFQELNHIMIEANYSQERIGDAPNREHILRGHMEIGTTCEFLRMNAGPALKSIILLHLSDNNSHEGDFIARAEKAAGCAVYVADKGIIVDLRTVRGQI